MDSYQQRARDEWRPRGRRLSTDRAPRRDLDGPGAKDRFAYGHGRSMGYDERDIRDRSRSPSPSRRDRNNFQRERRDPWRSGDRDRPRWEEDAGLSDTHMSRSDLLRAPHHLHHTPRPSRKLPRSSGGDYHDRYNPMNDIYDDTQQDDPPLYDGEDDVDPEGKATNFLLVRKLKESVTEDILACSIEKLCNAHGNDGATPGSLRRVLLIREKGTNRSAKFAFLEFSSIAEAKAAAMAAQALGDKMIVASKQVEISFPSRYNFQPASFGKVERNPKYMFELKEGENYKYKIQNLFPSVMVVNEQPPPKETEAPTTKTISPDNPPPPSAAAASKFTVDDGQTKAKKRKIQSGGAMPAQLALWQKRTEELHQGDMPKGEGSGTEDEMATGANAISAEEDKAIVQSFIHENNCHLCKTVIPKANLTRHVVESKVHAKHLEDSSRVEEAYAFMERRGVDPQSTLKVTAVDSGMEESAKPTYIDRAALRRQVEAQEKSANAPSEKHQVSISLKNSGNIKNKPSTPPLSSDPRPKALFGLGSRLLQKAGWKEGQGLGASGEGRTGSIEQEIYAAGVGLGHASSKKGDAVEEAERMTKGSGFADKTRDLARDRFNAMK